jgi:DivIVA domain-containing protein
MEWTAQSIRSVEFREKLRGYHPDDVDAFVERVAVAFEELQALVQRGASLPQVAVAAPPPVSEFAATVAPAAAEQSDEDRISEETIRRTLVMAQRTADMVIAEAQEQAAALLAEARAEADALLAGANEQSTQFATEAHDRLAGEVSDLEAARAELQELVASLEDYVASQRQRLRDLLVHQLENLDEETMGLEPPPGAPAAAGRGQRPATAEAPAVAADEPADGPWAEADASFPVATEPTVEFDSVLAGSDDLRLDPVVPVAPRAEPASEEFHLPGEGEDDPFLAELRRAIEDPGAAGPVDEPATDDLGAAVEASPDDPVPSVTTPGELRGMPEGGRLSGRLFRRK